jgi:putative transposase
MVKSHLQLQDADREFLQTLVSKPSITLKLFRRATALLELDRGQSLASVAAHLQVNSDTVATWRDAYHRERLAMLEDKPRSGRPVLIDGTARAKITALACSQAPTGHARWSLRLLADKVVELGHADAISHTQVGIILKKTNSNRT